MKQQNKRTTVQHTTTTTTTTLLLMTMLSVTFMSFLYQISNCTELRVCFIPLQLFGNQHPMLFQEYCSDLSADYFNCNMSSNCTLGNIYTTTCSTINQTNCDGNTIVEKTYFCKYCWQLTENVQYTCNYKPSQTGLQSGQDTIIVSCTVNRNVLCLGKRTFSKVAQVNYSTGKKWSSTFVFSLFLSGFSADRFYLGHAGWGVFKLFTLGGVGLWAIVDLVLVSVGYLGPGDGSVMF